MDRKISKTLRRLGNDREKNTKMVKSIPFSEEVIKEVINSDYDVSKKIDFLRLLFELNRIEAQNYFTLKRATSIGDIVLFIKNEFLDKSKDYYYTIDNYKKLLKFLNVLIYRYYDFSYQCLDNLDMIDIFNVVTKKFIENATPIETKKIKDDFLNFKRELYIRDFDKYFIGKNIDKSEDDLRTEITDCFSGINDVVAFRGTLLSRCTKHNGWTRVYDRSKFLMAKKLLEVGVDPNILNSNDKSFLFDLILISFDRTDLLYSVLVTAVEHGFDLNCEKDLLRILFECSNMTSELLVFLLDNGLKVTIEDVDDIRDRAYLDKNEEQLKELTNSVLTINEVNLLVEELTDNGYEIEDDFNKKIFINRNDFNNILIRVKDILGNYTTSYFSDLWFEIIVENRNNSINCMDNKITASEALEGLRKLAHDSVNVLDNDIDEQKNKIMTYKK